MFQTTSRTFLAAVIALLAGASCKSSTPALLADGGPSLPDEVTFPKGFLFGASTAAFQVEKGDAHTDWSRWVSTAGKIKRGDNPDVGGADALAHIDGDVKLMTDEAHNAYRFSVDWTRLYPTRASFDADMPEAGAIAAYDSLIDKLRAAKIIPLVTLLHYVLPEYLSDPAKSKELQGFERPEVPALFGEFCRRMGKRWGSKVDWWATLNEPAVVPIAGFVQASFPPGVALDTARAFAYYKGEAAAHVKCFDALHQSDGVDADGDGKAALVGPVVHQRAVEPLDPQDADDVTAAEHVRYVNNLWFLNVVVRGDYDDELDEKLDGAKDKKGDPSLKGRADYVGINYYSALAVSAHTGLVIPAPINASILFDHLPTTRPKTEAALDIYPEGLVTVLEEARDYGLPLVVTENGLADASDANRPRFIAEHLYQVGIALQRGIDVRGYFHWSLVDNFEWASGFCPKFGLHAIDPTTAARTARPSAEVYRKLIVAGKVTRADIAGRTAYATPAAACE